MTAQRTPRKRRYLPQVSQVLRSPVFWAVALRVAAFLLLFPIRFRGDAADYHTLAANLADGQGFSRCPTWPFPPTAQRPPLFPFLLSGLYFLGASPLWASFLLNLVIDLFSLGFARRWAQEAGLSEAVARKFTWFIALCPLLIAYASYPTTENISVLLFLLATLFVFRLGRASRKDQITVEGSRVRASFWAISGGIAWGLLALCRSYFLLFPAALLLFRPSPQWRRRWIALMFATSFIVPAIWVARNQAVFGRPVFSQGAAVGWQTYQGLCFTNFDWWDAEQVSRIYAHPILSRMLAGSCATDEALGALDKQVRDEVIQDCVLGQPFQAAVNVAVKGTMLFINWGQFLPYTEIPESLRWTINGLLLFYWWCAGWALWRNRRTKASRKQGVAQTADTPAVDPAVIRYAVLGLAYVVAVTLPFAVDARYLLGPFLITWAAAVAASGSVSALTLTGLRACWPFRRSLRRGSRTP